MSGPDDRPVARGWTTSPVVWGLLLALAVALFAGAVYVLIRREDDWAWDAVKQVVVGSVCLASALDRRRRGRAVR